MPEFLFEEKFFENVLKILKKNGFILFNTIANSKIKIDRNEKFIDFLKHKKITINKLSNIEGDNELIIILKN